MSETATAASANTRETETDRVSALIERAEKSKKLCDRDVALKEARAFFARYPEVARVQGDVTAHVEGDLIEGISGPYLAPAVEFTLSENRAALGYAEASGLERLLIDRLLACWLRVQEAEQAKTRHEEVKLEWGLTWDRRLEIANKNFLRAVKVLALIRRRPMPHMVMQVNVGAADLAVGPCDGNGA